MASSNYKNFIRIPKRKKGLHTSSETDLSKSKLSTLERIVLSKTKVYTHQSSNSSYIQNTTFRSPQNYHSASSNNLDNLSTIKLSNLLPTLDDTLRYPSNLKKIPPVIPNEEVSDISSDNYIHLNEFDHRRAKTLMDNRRIGYQNPSFYCEFSINRDPLSSIELNQFASHDSSNLVQKKLFKKLAATTQKEHSFFHELNVEAPSNSNSISIKNQCTKLSDYDVGETFYDKKDFIPDENIRSYFY